VVLGGMFVGGIVVGCMVVGILRFCCVPSLIVDVRGMVCSRGFVLAVLFF